MTLINDTEQMQRDIESKLSSQQISNARQFERSLV